MSEPLAPAYREALEGAREEWGRPLDVAAADGLFPQGPPGVIIALGGSAAASARRHGAPLVVALAPSDRGATVFIAMTPSPERLVSLLAARGVRRLLAVRAAPAESEFSRRTVAAGRAAGVRIEAAVLSSPRSMPGLLRRAGMKADALWLAPDPDSVTPGTFAAAREFSRARGIPFFAPAAGLVSEESLGDLAVSFRDCGREAARAARELLAGRPVAKVVYPGETPAAADPPR
ncbi:MAG: hypothetical protein Q8T11_15695 [Elusimicrobiota bacterium]|nr:hypothetical protein [Elusimicrobiota bacterium]